MGVGQKGTGAKVEVGGGGGQEKAKERGEYDMVTFSVGAGRGMGSRETLK